MSSALPETHRARLHIASGSKGAPAKWQGIGIRIKDGLRATACGHEVLTIAPPKAVEAVEAIEALMA